MEEASVSIAAPSVHTEERTLTVLGTSSTLIPAVIERAEQDLGIRITTHVLDGTSAHRQAILKPEIYDVYDQWFHNLELVWAAASLQPIDTRRLPHWSAVGEIETAEKLVVEPPNARGKSPNSLLFVQSDGGLDQRPSDLVSMLPVSHGAEAFGYRLRDLPSGASLDRETWAWLLDPSFRGAWLQDNVSIGAMEAIMAVEAAGLLHFSDPSNLTIDEIDRLISVLLKFRRSGQLAGTWTTPEKLATLVGRRHVRIFSLWTSAMGRPELIKHDVRAAAPTEGYRGWYGGMGLSRFCRGVRRDIAYDYLNWWIDGGPMTAITRQGYFYSSHRLARKHMDPAEYAYWYLGEAAADKVYSNQDTVIAVPGEYRSGGTYMSQMSRIAIWNSVMDEHNYLSRRWNDCFGD